MNEDTSGQSWLKQDGWAILCLSVSFLLLYLRTLCPTVYLGDSGEIATAIATGGIIHPPGYPLLSVLGRLAMLAVPGGEPAYRIGCMVALAAGVTVGVLYQLAREIGASRWAAVSAAAAFGLSRAFWSQSTRVEVYSLHTLLVCLALLAALRYRRTGQFSWLAMTTLVISLGLAHHLTIVLLGPGLLLLCVGRLRTDGRWRRHLPVLAALLLVGPSLYLLLMLWARQDPLQAWGNPVTLPLLWNHASARVYRGLLEFPDVGYFHHRLTGTWRLFNDTFPAATGLLALLGALLLCRRNRIQGLGLLLVPAVVIAYNFCYRIDDIAPYYLSAWIVLAALMGQALDAASSLLRGTARSRFLAVAAPAALVTILLSRNWASCDLSRATWVGDFARHKLENTDPSGVLITATDDDTFPVWYVHDLLKVRPDVVHLDRRVCGGMWSSYERDPSLWYIYRLRRQGVPAPMSLPRQLSRWNYLASDGYLIDLLQGPLRGRPVCITFLNSKEPPERDRKVLFRWAAAHYQPLPKGIIIRLQPKERPVDLPALLRDNEHEWSRMALPDLRYTRTDDELHPDYVSDQYACSLVNFGGLYELAGNRDRAAALYRRAQAWAPAYRPAAAALAALRASVDRPRAGRGREG